MADEYQQNTPEKLQNNYKLYQRAQITHARRYGQFNSTQDDTLTPQANTHHQRRKAIVLRGPNYSKHLFPLYRDRDIGFTHEFQDQIHSSYNDDDRMTTTTQLHMAISQTYKDLIESVQQAKQPTQTNYFHSQ